MLRSLKNLEHYKVMATDGHIGSVANFFLDDELWTVRYLVVEAGGLFIGHRVLISPISFRKVDWSNEQFHLELIGPAPLGHAPRSELHYVGCSVKS